MSGGNGSIYKTPEGEQAVMARYDQALAAWPVPCEARTIPTAWGDTFVLACGDPALPPLILLHGAGANSAIWIGDVADYTRAYRVYAIDLLGEAGKSAPNRPSWKSSAYADWLGAALDALNVQRASFVGISQGSWTALKFAVSQPDRVEKMALLCPGGIVPDRMSFLLKAVVYSLAGKHSKQSMMRLLYGDQTVPEGVDDIMELITKNFKSRVGVLPLFTDEELRRLASTPMLILGGAKDALRDHTKIAARLKNILPDVQVEIVPGAGHAVLNTSPRVMQFLKGI